MWVLCQQVVIEKASRVRVSETTSVSMNQPSIVLLLGIESTPVSSYPDNLDHHLIPMHLRPPFRDEENKIIRIIRISPFSYFSKLF